MTKLPYMYRADVMRVVDGDTMDLLIDLGFRFSTKQRVRLYGVNTPETYGVKKGSEEYIAGLRAKKAVHDWLDINADGHTVAPTVVIKSYDGRPLGQGKYGRWLVQVLPANPEVEEETSLNDWLVEQGFAERKTY